MQGGRRTADMWRLPAGCLPKTRAALSYAEQAHAGQRRAVDSAPFIVHPVEVAELLYRAGAPDHVIAAGLLHDVLEKTAVGVAELRKRFGSTIAKIVLAVSEDDRETDYEHRKAGLRERVAAAGDDALWVFAADKISKVRELSVAGGADPHRHRAGSPTLAQRLAHYHHCMQLLEAVLADSPLVRLFRHELERVSEAGGEPALASAR